MSQAEQSLARTPEPPYYAVVFTSVRSGADPEGYAEAAAAMEELAKTMPGFLGIESARDARGVGITVSYWRSLEEVRAWGRHADHLRAQAAGRGRWYEAYRLRVCRVEQERGFGAPGEPAA